MKRRDFLRNLGVTAATAAAAPQVLAAKTGMIAPDVHFNPDSDARGELNTLDVGLKPLKADINKPITVVVVGAGNRGNVYASYAAKYPDLVKIVGVSDILPNRVESFSKKYDIPKEHQFGHYNEILSVPKFADAMVIATPDDRHFDPCMKALALGYDVLLEKPMAQTAAECRKLLAQSKKYGRILATCHVLRYAPYFVTLKYVLDHKYIGDVVSIQHMEPVEYCHMAHSYVRGKWRDSKETTPMILAKSCHDLDIIRWLVNEPCTSIVADGDLYLFKEDMAPEGAPLRCTDGCPHEGTCPYSAIDIYVRKKGFLYVFDDLDYNDDEAIMERLRTTQFGRCVYHCDNDQPDHYVCNMVFNKGITSSFTMDAFTPCGGRRTRIMGTTGFIDGDMDSFCITDFRTRKKLRWNAKIDEIPTYKGSGHGGGDHALFRDFVEAVSWQDPKRLTSTVDQSIESHLMGYAAEVSRKTGRKVKVKV